MNKFIPLLILVASFIAGCQSYKDEFEYVSRERDSLIYMTDVKDSSLRSFMTSFSEIENNLDTITHHQTDLMQDSSMLTLEVQGDQLGRINNSIHTINQYLERNRDIIAGLKSQLGERDSRIAILEDLINKLNQKVEKKEAELIPLKVQLDEKQVSIESLQVKVDTLTAKAAPKDPKAKERLEKLNTAYYVADTYKKLRFNGIVDMKGGFLGIGKNQTLKQDFKTEEFTKINITEVTTIDLNCKEASLITNHPSDSYVFVKENDTIRSLSINDYDKFWGASKYLVIVKN